MNPTISVAPISTETATRCHWLCATAGRRINASPAQTNAKHAFGETRPGRGLPSLTSECNAGQSTPRLRSSACSVRIKHDKITKNQGNLLCKRISVWFPSRGSKHRPATTNMPAVLKPIATELGRMRTIVSWCSAHPSRTYIPRSIKENEIVHCNPRCFVFIFCLFR